MDISEQIQKQIISAARDKQALQIIGNNTKSFYGCNVSDANLLPLYVADHNGILDFQPTELTVNARAGTPLNEIISTLAEQRQMLPFEPPVFDNRATLGGCVASALVGPRRPWTGAVRDYLIGTRILTGDGKEIRLGGKVMKNVAGYDLFRPMAGALGTLGLMLDITLKLLPLPEHEASYSMSMDINSMQQLLRDLRRRSMPVSAASYHQGQLFLRLSGSTTSIDDAANYLPDEMKETTADYWHDLNEHKLSFFDVSTPLYRLVVPTFAPYDTFAGECLADWGGALRWIKTPLSLGEVQKHAADLGGTASAYRNDTQDGDVFSPLPGHLLDLHKRMKMVMDPAGILNPGRLYRDL
ncbi:MAG: glycolate oxidase subunit GlcE [Gammaproteobacteria bacterium]|nr:glycolate oxidase subunit GlcE [Gammaproteobacteria bacterium]MDX2487065.1 glycolate oxidase subunit GlcE [Gammaproteobacteria bacterium]